MAIKLGPDIASLSAQRHLADHGARVSKAFERLSTGLRINHPQDDPAGMVLAAQLSTDTRVYSQARRNLNDGISLLNIAEGALEAIKSISQRHLELATQAANGVYSSAQRSALQSEADALTAEYDRIIASTTYNGRSVFSVSSPELSLQAGYGTQSALSVSIGESLATGSATTSAYTSDGTFVTPHVLMGNIGGYEVAHGDFNEDGKEDIFASGGAGGTRVYLSNGDGTFKLGTNSIYNGTGAVETSDLDQDGHLDLIISAAGATTRHVYYGNGNGSFGAALVLGATSTGTYDADATDLNEDGRLDVVFVRNGVVDVYLSTGARTYSAPTQVVVTGATVSKDAQAGDFNEDGNMDIAVAMEIASFDGKFAILFGAGDGTFSSQLTLDGGYREAIKVADLNGDGNLDIIGSGTYAGIAVKLGNGNGTFKGSNYYGHYDSFGTGIEVGDVNDDDILDVVVSSYGASGNISVLLGAGNGTLKAAVSYSPGAVIYDVALVDVTGDGVEDVVFGGPGGAATNYFVGTSTLSQVTVGANFARPALDLTSQASARIAMDTVQETLALIETEQGTLGAFRSRVEVATSNLESLQSESAAALSRITSVDVAEEVAELVRAQILQNVVTALLAQSNVQSNIALKLLQ